MSFSCTLHPVDRRVALALSESIRGERPNWDAFLRLRQKKQMIDRVNQPFKKGLRELLAENQGFNPEIHLWGRPFLIYTNDAEEVAQKIAEFYGVNNEAEVLNIILAELRKFSAAGFRERADFCPPKPKEAELGLKEVIKDLQLAYKHKKYNLLGSEIGFIMAQLLGVAYPYWWVENYGLSFLMELGIPGWEQEPAGLAGLFNDLPELNEFLPQRLNRNLAAGVYFEPHQVREVLKLLKQEEPYLVQKMEQKQLLKETAVDCIQKTKEALTYAKGCGFGLMEASDIFEDESPRYP